MQLIESLGCGAVLNIPVWTDDELLGTINCLDGAGSYGPAHVRAAEGFEASRSDLLPLGTNALKRTEILHEQDNNDGRDRCWRNLHRPGLLSNSITAQDGPPSGRQRPQRHRLNTSAA